MIISKAGFTLLEVLLATAAIAAIAGLAVPVYQSFQVRNDLDIAAVTLAQSLRRAAVLAQAADGDSGAGVHVAVGSIIIFRGQNFAKKTKLSGIGVQVVSSYPGTNKTRGLPTWIYQKLIEGS